MRTIACVTALLVAIASIVVRAQNPISMRVDVFAGSGQYNVVVNGELWHQSGPTSITIGAKLYSTADGTLSLNSTREFDGSDSFLGNYNATEFNWLASDPASTTWTTRIYAYQYPSSQSPVTVVFEQYFPVTVQTGASDLSSDTEVVAAWPSFLVDNPNSLDTLNYLTYYDTFAYCHIGHWRNGPAFPGGNEGGSPVVWFDRNLNSLIMSPLTNFMVGAQTLSAQNGGALAAGFTAKVLTVPAGTVHQTVLYADTGMNDALYRWGDILLNTHPGSSGVPKQRTLMDADYALKWLGYWTDNGGAYWYQTENATTNYQQTMLDAQKYLSQVNIPASYFQLDSWWYPKDVLKGLTIWEPMPEVFPSGMDPAWLGEPLFLHSRWFSPINEYITSGNYSTSFIVEEIAALPIKSDVFVHLMSKAKAWGMFTYEQDWLSFVYRQMLAPRNSVDNGRLWLTAMGDAATQVGVTIQYCMPLPAHVLQSTKIQPVTTIRASDDYRPGRTFPPNWQVAHTSMLIHAVGSVSFKDDFWSTDIPQPGCPYQNASGCWEPNPRLEAIISAVTGGPIAPSDKIGTAVPALIMETCTASGLLLKPDRPATYLDSTFQLSFDSLADIKAWHTVSDLGADGLVIHYLLIMDISEPYVIRTQDLGIFGARRSFVYEYNSSNSIIADSVQLLTPEQTITVAAAPNPGSNTPRYYRYFVITPELPNGWVFLGEPNKMIGGSRTRFTNVGVSPERFTLTVNGAPGEVVNTAYIGNAGSIPTVGPVTYVYNIPCTIGSDGTAEAVCGGDTCKCA